MSSRDPCQFFGTFNRATFCDDVESAFTQKKNYRHGPETVSPIFSSLFVNGLLMFFGLASGIVRLSAGGLKNERGRRLHLSKNLFQPMGQRKQISCERERCAHSRRNSCAPDLRKIGIRECVCSWSGAGRLKEAKECGGSLVAVKNGRKRV